MSAIPVLAQSGEVTFVNGPVTIQRGAERFVPIRGTSVRPLDVIQTGADGMVQLVMIDQASLSLRSNSQLIIEQYPISVNDPPGAILKLTRGTLRSFTTLLTERRRADYKLNTKLATIGIRGSGGILQHEDDTTIHYTIEGSHIVASLDGKFPPIVTTPNQTVQVVLGQAPKLVATPPSLLDAGKMTGSAKEKKPDGEEKIEAQSPQASTSATASSATTGSSGSSAASAAAPPPPIGLTVIDATASIGSDPFNLQNVVIAAGGATGSDLAIPAGMTLGTDGSLRAYTAYAANQSGTAANVVGGIAREVQTVTLSNNTKITLGRWEGASSFGFGGVNGGPGSPAGGGVHWAYGGAGFPSYLSDVLTGTVSYTRQAATTPTNQFGNLGTLANATLDVNFTARTLNAVIGVTMNAGSGVGSGSWTLTASNVPFSFNAFFASGTRVTVTNAFGASSATNPRLGGSIEGSFVGTTLNGAILGYSIVDQTSGNNANSQRINGVVVYSGPSQNAATPYRDGLVSDPTNSLAGASFIRSLATTNREAEVTVTTNGVTAFTAPFPSGNDLNGHRPYAQGTATIIDNGFDPTTGLVWGRWAGGNATVGGQNLGLAQSSLHYIFSPVQSGPVTLPLTGSAVYDVVGSTRPTNLAGQVGVFNSASLNANFSARTVDTSVNITINGQTWAGAANGVPIYRDQYFSAYAGGPNLTGIPRPAAFNITCTPNCTPTGVTGSIDGFFTGRRGNGAGVMYNMNNNAGAIAFSRRGG